MTAPKQIRCAIYTRKPSEEGLDQSSNSLRAQREACEAYVLSQKHEGWHVIATAYNDGGFSGGNMERPGLKKLLADITSAKIDTVVVCKVDRLTRSLSDFARIVESFDNKSVSFVSVTQQVNTTPLMGRLTLNPELRQDCTEGRAMLLPDGDGNVQIAFLPRPLRHAGGSAKNGTLIPSINLLVNPLLKNLDGPRPRCDESYICDTNRQRVYCSRRCGSAATSKRRSQDRGHTTRLRSFTARSSLLSNGRRHARSCPGSNGFRGTPESAPSC